MAAWWLRTGVAVAIASAALTGPVWAGGDGMAPVGADDGLVAAPAGGAASVGDGAAPGGGVAAPNGKVLKEENVRGQRAREQRRYGADTHEDELIDALIPEVRTSGKGKAVGLCVAPGGTDEGTGFGAELYRVRRDGQLTGGALWFAGSLASPDVNAAIPHEDFTRRGYDSKWGLLYLFGKANGRVAVIGGVGPALVRVQYIDRSNVTGWTWDGGGRTVLGMQGQLGVLVRAGRRSAARLGWDSQFGGFVGVTVGF